MTGPLKENVTEFAQMEWAGLYIKNKFNEFCLTKTELNRDAYYSWDCFDIII